MATISATMVKELRDKTGVGMMDCKKALVQAEGDMDLAIEHLRKAGIAKAAKKAGRTAKEGRIVSLVDEGTAVLVEVLCETDFVAKTDDFGQYAGEVAQRAKDDYDTDGDMSAAVSEAESDRLTALIGKIGENMQVRRVVRWESSGAFGSYLHMGGRIGVLVDVTGAADEALLKDICMHIAAFNPRFISPDQVPDEVLEKEKEIAAAQVEGKPANIIGKIVTGKINKWYTESCLTHQPWIRDDKSSLRKAAPGVTITRFVRWEVGEELKAD